MTGKLQVSLVAVMVVPYDWSTMSLIAQKSRLFLKFDLRWPGESMGARRRGEAEVVSVRGGGVQFYRRRAVCRNACRHHGRGVDGVFTRGRLPDAPR